MGNWRTVQIIGEVKNYEEVGQLINYLTVDKNNYTSKAYNDDIYYLQFGIGLCGLNQWVNFNGKINTIGNVFERDCEIEDLEKELNILANKFKSLDITLHVGDDYESLDCVASFIVKNGRVEKHDPLVKEIESISLERMEMNLKKALGIF